MLQQCLVAIVKTLMRHRLKIMSYNEYEFIMSIMVITKGKRQRPKRQRQKDKKRQKRQKAKNDKAKGKKDKKRPKGRTI